MRVLVDTPVWSLALRNQAQKPQIAPVVELFRELILEGRVCLIACVRQEMLSGIKDNSQFEQLKQKLQAFPEPDLNMADYEIAALYFNLCRPKGIQGSHTDFLICAIAQRRKWQILSTDKNFIHYQTVLPIDLYPL